MLRRFSVLDLNHILLFIACVSPVILLARTCRRTEANRSWRLAAIAVLVVTGLAVTITPRNAGFFGGGAWLLLLFLPTFGLRRAAELAFEQRFATARRIVGCLRFLHPIATLRDERRLMRGLELAQLGETEAAEEILMNVARANNRAGRQAAAQLFRIRGDWNGLAVWSRHDLPEVALGGDPDLLPLCLQALGETGARDQMVLQFARNAPRLLASPSHQQTFAASLMPVLAFCGRTSALVSLFETRLRRLPRDAREYWMATSKAAAGENGAGRARLERLRHRSSDALIRMNCEQRLRRSMVSSPLPLSRVEEATVSRLERTATRPDSSLLAPRTGQLTPVVFVIIALNLCMFLVEIALGGSMNDATLHRLGALEPFAVLSAGEYWRLGSALFLHYGAVHLLVNLYALYVLGPPLEAEIGPRLFALCYLLAGLGSSIGVVALWRFGVTKADFLVGASGAVMGIVGAWAGLLSRQKHLPVARRRLASIGLIVLIQTAFDFWTPQVSMAAHLSGLVTGG
ncbi:MAG: rhomboid family intramembrane serine protease, partial [Chthoniobacterales bacterium]|nr:rhomboid family intramembrane serine protease [Chthoniobacterales bacterium]